MRARCWPSPIGARGAASLRAFSRERPDDAEHQMDVLRHFRHAQTFRLLAQDLAGLSHRRAPGRPSVRARRRRARRRALGVLEQLAGRDAAPPRFAIVGYGKLGGKELGYVSDLDLVFLFDIAPDDPDADAREFAYTRLAQRLNTWLTSTTPAGPLYDTDLRLRPDGAKGLLASSLRGFARYQREQAWLWEHQALTRARFVAGDAEVGAAFEAEREAILTLPRDMQELKDEIVAMRRKMHAGHPNATPLFDLKHDPGGMVDIEFTVQCLVLGHAHRHPSLTRNAGNIALLHMAGDLGLVPAALARDSRRCVSRLPQAATQGAPDRRGAGARRSRAASRPARRGCRLWTHVFGAPWTT